MFRYIDFMRLCVYYIGRPLGVCSTMGWVDPQDDSDDTVYEYSEMYTCDEWGSYTLTVYSSTDCSGDGEEESVECSYGSNCECDTSSTTSDGGECDYNLFAYSVSGVCTGLIHINASYMNVSFVCKDIENDILYILYI